jgi:hypothetical protein
LLISLGLLVTGYHAGLAQASPLARECVSNRRSGFRGRAGQARFDMDHHDPRFRPRTATLTRRVLCGFVDSNLARSSEHMYLRLMSADMRDPGFSTGQHLSDRYYLVCEGGLGTTLGTFVVGQVLTFADNTFTLPCTPSVYPAGVYDPAQASRITGRVGYRMESAALEVRRAPTLADPRFDVVIDVVVVNVSNLRETLRLRGRVFGELSSTFTIIDCPKVRPHTKQEPHPACP